MAKKKSAKPAAAKPAKGGAKKATVAKAKAAPPKAEKSAKAAKAEKAAPKAAEKAAPKGAAKAAKKAKAAGETRRILVKYHDGDGITVLVDQDSLVRRAASGELVLEADPTPTLVRSINLHDVVAFGTHGGGDSSLVIGLGAPFGEGDLRAEGMRSRVSCGLLVTSGRLVVSDWSRFLSGCAEHQGVVPGEAREVPPGRYKVTVWRNVGRGLGVLEDEDATPDEGDSARERRHLVWLEPVDASDGVPRFVNVPGADGRL